jgi:ABC-type transport system involved in multi-copper enzyme maturation permease subunit
MLTLMAKDFRQTFWPALLAVLLLVAPSLAWLSGTAADGRWPDRDRASIELIGLFLLGAVLSLAASSAITGVAFAKERRERTAELLATLPIPRWTVVTSKALTALIVVAVPFLVGMGASVLLAIKEDQFLGDRLASGLTAGMFLIAAVWLTLFGLGWALSSLLRSEVLSAAAPILVVIVVSAMIVWSRPRPGMMAVQQEDALLVARGIWAFGTLGITGLIAGTVIALKRRSP